MGREAARTRAQRCAQPSDSIEHQVAKETQGTAPQQTNDAVPRRTQGNRFGQQVEKRDGDDRPGTEAKNEVQFVLQVESKQPPRQMSRKMPQWQ